MTKKDVIDRVKTLKLPQGEYIVYGAAPFAVYGIREANDIDLLVSQNLFEQLKRKGWKQITKGPKDEPVTKDVFEAHNSWEFSPYAPTLLELLSRATVVEGISFASLEDVRKWKETSGRPKDLVDLQLIKDFLSKTT